MNKKEIIGHSLFLILFNIIISSNFFVKTVNWRGMLVEGMSKYIVISYVLFFVFYTYIREFFFKKYELYIEEKKIFFHYLISPLFFTWIAMCIYLIVGDKIECIESFNQYVFIYLLLCLLSIYFQYRLFIKFEKIKNEKILEIKNAEHEIIYKKN